MFSLLELPMKCRFKIRRLLAEESFWELVFAARNRMGRRCNPVSKERHLVVRLTYLQNLHRARLEVSPSLVVDIPAARIELLLLTPQF
jgi:hypothetical protein